jgi:hypothetical protein
MLGTAHAVAMTATPTGQGYWIVASDGTVHEFGDAPKLAATVPINNAIVGIAETPTGQGAWLLTAGGGVAATGDAQYLGAPIRSGYCPGLGSGGIAATATGAGYWVVQRGGMVMTFGDAQDYGSSNGTNPIVGIERS